MRNIIPILLVTTVLLAGCHSPSPVRSQAATPAVVPPPFRPLLITAFGTHPAPDDSWRIGVARDSIIFGRPNGSSVSYTPESQGWQARAGWFVFIESESKVWAYDGNRMLYLYSENSGSGGIYIGVFRATSFDSNFPCAVPPGVISSLPGQKQKEIQTHG